MSTSTFQSLKALAKLQSKSAAAVKLASEGPSTEPTTTPATEGARAAEAAKDVREIVPVAGVGAVENKERDGTGLDTPDVANNGLKPGPAGTDVPSTQSQQKDPGTSHPAKAGAECCKEASARDLLSLGNQLLATATVGLEKVAGLMKQAEEEEAEEKKSKDSQGKGDRLNPAVATGEKGDAALGSNGKVKIEAASKETDPKTAGFEAGKATAETMQKQAADEEAALAYFRKEAALAAQTMAKQAVNDAHDMAEFMLGYKQAEAGAEEAAAAAGAGGPPPPEAGAGPDAAGGAGAGIDPQALAQLLQSVPPEQLPELIQKLQAQGIEIPPEILQALGLGGDGGAPPAGGGGGGGAPPAEAGGGAPPAGGPPAAGGPDIEAAKQAAFRMGKEAAMAEVRDSVFRAMLTKQAIDMSDPYWNGVAQDQGQSRSDKARHSAEDFDALLHGKLPLSERQHAGGDRGKSLGEGAGGMADSAMAKLHGVEAAPGIAVAGGAGGAAIGGLLAQLMSDGDNKTRNTILAALGGGAAGALGGAAMTPSAAA